MQDLLAPPTSQPDDRLGRFLWRLIEASPVAVVAVDQNGAILYANQKLAKMFHYAVNDLIGHPIEILIPERYRSDHRLYRNLFAENPHVRQMRLGLDWREDAATGAELPDRGGAEPFPRR